MPNINLSKRNLQIAGLIAAIVIAVILIVILLVTTVRNLSRGSESAMPYVIATSFPTQALPQATAVSLPTAIPTQNPNDFSGDWYFVEMKGKAASGILKGHDIGVFRSASGEQITATCAAPRSPAPKAGDLFRWDANTNILYPVNDNPQGSIQRFWYPTRLNPAG